MPKAMAVARNADRPAPHIPQRATTMKTPVYKKPSMNTSCNKTNPTREANMRRMAQNKPAAKKPASHYQL